MEIKTITGAELARHVGVSPAYISRLLKNNQIPHMVIGKNRYPLWDCVDIIDKKWKGDFCLNAAREMLGYSISDSIEWAKRINALFSDNCWWITQSQISEEVNRKQEIKQQKKQ